MVLWLSFKSLPLEINMKIVIDKIGMLQNIKAEERSTDETRMGMNGSIPDQGT